MGTDLMTIPLSKLQRSTANVRRTDSKGELEELAASIAALGVLQNLTVQPTASKSRKSKGKYEVVAGGRRLAALQLLASRRQLAKDYPVPCRVLADNDAAEVSLAENIVRVPLHPADQFDAFSKLHAEGLGVEDIAARFGIEPKIVQQRLKLAAVSPKLMEVYRVGDMTLDQLVAFTLTDDHDAQERVWFDGLGYERQPHAIRRMLTRALVEGSDRRAKFIGAAAYEAAGGTVVRDLFRSEDDGYFSDSQLLDHLVSEKLAEEADRLKAEGWAWVQVFPEVDYGYIAGFRLLSPTEVALSAEDEAKFTALSQRHDELVAELDEDSSETFEAEFERVSAELGALAQRKEQWTDEQKAGAGVVISLDYHGTLSMISGLVKEEASASQRGSSSQDKGPRTAQPERPRLEPSLSEHLIEDLSAHRTAALRAAIAARPDVAMAAILHAFVLRIFFSFSGETCVDIQPRIADMRPSAEGIGESKAAAAMAERHQQWLARMPEAEGLFAWLSEQSGETQLELLAYCVAASVNAVSKRHGIGAQDRLDQADTLARAVALDMADWWEATKERYLSRVSKAHIVAAVTEAVSKSAADNIAGMKKEPMVLRAEELLAGRRWLPELLRTPAAASDSVAAE